MILANFIPNIFLNLIFPKYCLGCGHLGTYICAECFHTKIKLNFSQKCHVCEKECRLGMVHVDCKENSYLDGLTYVCVYNDLVRDLIEEAKYQLHYAVLKDISKIMVEYNFDYKFLNNTVLTSVPLHKEKLIHRGFNQSEILAQGLSKGFGGPYFDLLKRVRSTKTQVGMNQHEREKNLKNAFEFIKPEIDISNKSVTLVDDIYTTGTTLNECAKVLKENGVEKVYGVVFAKSRG